MRRTIFSCGMVLACAASALAQQFPPTTPRPSTIPPAGPTAPDPNTKTPAAPAPLPSGTPQPVVLATRQTSFTIPFTVDPRSGAVELQLYTSLDQGKTWTLASRETLPAKQFTFRAGEDGEYWFASRVIDAQGRGPSLDKLTAELRVKVDTSTPKVDVNARVNADGQIVATWNAQDNDLLLESVKLEYQAAGDVRWQSIALDPLAVKKEANSLSGEATWLPTTGHRAINLRIVARDSAGNIAVVNRGVYRPSAQPVARTGTTKTPAPIDVDPFHRTDARTTEQPRPQWPAEKVADKPRTTPPANANTIANDVKDNHSFSPFKPVAAPVESPVANKVETPPTTTAPADNTATPVTDRPDLPSGETPTYTSKRRFKLDYDADDIPQEHIASVELWGTPDGGKTWQKWGVDGDKQSPFEIEVEREGMFGFRIVIVHQNGMAGHAPKPGDTADLWVGVDATQPVAKFGKVAYGKGLSSGQLSIEWSASDAFLSARPITLHYSADPQGPWNPIVTGLANTGQYYWRVEPTVPRKVYLKLEARDEAGNVAEDRLPDVVQLEGLAPRGRIRGVE